MANPNTWAKAVVKNSWGTDIKLVRFQHRYDQDHYDSKDWDSIPNGSTSEQIAVGYWTGFGRTGYDYWYISFIDDGKEWFCKDNFYCFLTKADAGKTVVCEIYRDGDGGKMRVNCPGSSDCIVSLDSNDAKPNSWATAVVQNNWGERIVNVQFRHRYDNDHMDHGEWQWLDKGVSSEAVKVGFWTGFDRIGYDYWWVKFEAGCFTCICKDDFYCFLTKDDKGLIVKCRIYTDGKDVKMDVDCPQSSDCTVSLFKAVRKSDREVGDDPASPFPREQQRPVYLIAHHCNAPEEINDALEKGANAIECDIMYDEGSDSWQVYHGLVDPYPGPTPPTKLSDWLASAKEAAQNYGKQFALIIFDNKSPGDFKAHNFQGALDAVRAALPHDLNLIFSTADYDDRDDLGLIFTQLRPNEGVAIDQDNDSQEVQDYFNQRGVSSFWYGNGIATFGPDPFGHTWSSMIQATGMRDQVQGIKKVYVWTLANEESIANYLSIARVDGIMVNRATLREAKKIINAAWDARLADRRDPAFLVFGSGGIDGEVRQITCISRGDRHNPDRRIQAIGGESSTGYWKLSLAEAIAQIENGRHFYVERPVGDRVEVIVAMSKRGHKYLKTVADGDKPNNLLALPECP